MLMAHRTTHNGRRYSLANKAKALAVILREEFDVAFVSYDAATGVRIGSSESQQCNDTWVALDASTVTELAAGGPTRTGHRTPAVIVNVAVRGTDEATVRANSWMFEQVLATGVHGILLCHATTGGAVRAFVEAVRYPNREQGVGKAGLQEGRRGAHGAATASTIWEYPASSICGKQTHGRSTLKANCCSASR